MKKSKLHSRSGIIVASAALLGCVIVASFSAWLGWRVQTDFGKVEVSNVVYENSHGVRVRAKLLRPRHVTSQLPSPGAIYFHGYQNNRETSDPYCIELARRGIVALCVDAIGRGNSGLPTDPEEPDFDKTYGGKASYDYMRSLPFVKKDSIGLMGHSLGGEVAYNLALMEPDVRGLVISAFAYDEKVSPVNPKNMLMMFGKWDEFRGRMTGTRDVEREWMATARGKGAFSHPAPKLDTTYGDHEFGTARRVAVKRGTHIQISHSEIAVEEAVAWMGKAFRPKGRARINIKDQIWPIKEWATLVAMLAGIWSLLPLGYLLLQTKLLSPIKKDEPGEYICKKGSYLKHTAVNGVLLWLYLPIVFLLFGVHVYIVRVDTAFPMMIVNGIVWWFLWVNIIGFFLFKRWYKIAETKMGLSLFDLGISFKKEGLFVDFKELGKTALAALCLFGFVYLLEHLLEAIFIIDYRFIFPFASDFTDERLSMFPRYFPFILFGFLQTGFFLHCQLRRSEKKTFFRTFVSWSSANILVLVIPLILFLMVQYVPLFSTGFIPFVGPGGVFVSFLIDLVHVIGVLVIVTPISTFFYQVTRRPYLGAIVNALLVTWMFTSSQVIAPIPI